MPTGYCYAIWGVSFIAYAIFSVRPPTYGIPLFDKMATLFTIRLSMVTGFQVRNAGLEPCGNINHALILTVAVQGYKGAINVRRRS